MKKTILSIFAALLIFGSGVAQNKTASASTGVTKADQNSASQPVAPAQLATAQNRCGTLTPPTEWDIAFNKEVERFKADLAAGKVQLAANYTIPVIVHILHNGDAVGSSENISAAQVQSQIDALNADFAGTGFGIGGTPSVWQSLIADVGITFCLAKQDVNGNALAEYGIDRINWSTNGWTNPETFTQPSQLSSLITFMNGTVKPASIWDPTKYFNFWVANFSPDCMLGFGNFPMGTSLPGLTSGALETSTTAGCLAATRVFGTVGFVANTPGSALYNKGRTTTHEVGHNFGLRHIWGDAACGDDYCNDTPPAAAYNLGNGNGSCVSLPFHVGTCSGNSPNGEMIINFMDYTNDECMWMFTNDQKARMLTALTTGTYRSPLTASNKCQASGTFVTPVANFSANPTTVAVGAPVAFTDLSSGPAQTYTWAFTGGTPSASSTANPSVTYSTPGTYAVSLTVGNTAGSDNETKNAYITVVAAGTTCDTLSNVGSATATYYTLGPGAGYVSGHNTYQQKAKADKFTPQSGQTGYKIQGAYIAFALAKGASANSQTKIAVWNNAGTSGAPGTILDSKMVSNTSITAGQYAYYDFANTPVIGSAFYVGMEITYAVGDTMVIFTSEHNVSNTNTAWEQQSDGSWVDYSTGWQLGQGNPLKCSHFVLPVICPPVGISETILGANTHLYPNPTSGEVFMNIAQLSSSDITVEVYNLVGQVVESTILKNVLAGNYSINLADQQNGVYFVKLSNGSETTTKRIVLSH